MSRIDLDLSSVGDQPTTEVAPEPAPVHLDPSPEPAPARLTIFTATTNLGKKRFLNPDGTPGKVPLGEMFDGSYATEKVADLDHLGFILEGLNHKQALSFGVFAAPKGIVCTAKAEDLAESRGETPLAIARTKRNMTWPVGPGILMLDYDTSAGRSLSKDELVATIRAACPFLRDVAMLWRPSAGSNILNTATGEMVVGLAGQRLYLIVSEGHAIPRVGKMIHEHLWLAGHGFYLVSRSGQLLDRSPVDTSCWQTNRLDFAGGAVCVDPLQQVNMQAVLIPGDKMTLDVAEVPDELDTLKSLDLRSKRHTEKQAVAPEAKVAREKWIDERVADVATDEAFTDEEARDMLRRAAEHRILFGNFKLMAEGGRVVTVGEILDNPKAWHRKRFADPLEPEYHDGDTSVAMIHLFSGGKPYISSFAHGGCRFELCRAASVLQVTAGQTPRLVDDSMVMLRKEPDLFDAGEGLIRVAGNVRTVVTRDYLTDRLERLIRFERFNKKEDKWKPCPCPNEVAARVLAKSGERHLPQLTAISTAPTMTPSGRLLAEPGFDDETGILLLNETDNEWPRIPLHPSEDDCRRALAYLWRPFAQFKFVDEGDDDQEPRGRASRGGMFAAILTAMVRPTLPTAPSFAFDAPTQGSGKTLLCRCLAALAGTEPAISPPFGDAEEARKRIMSELLRGSAVIVVDNVVGRFDSPVLAACLTEQNFSDRLLGASTMVTVPSRSLWLMSGNNLHLHGELTRRVFKIRIDPGCEVNKVYKRAFSFDPAEMCQADRLRMVSAGMIALRYYQTTCKIPGGCRLGSFEKWSDLVGRAVAWFAEQGLAPVAIADPITLLDRQAENDPELETLGALLDAWYECCGPQPKTVKDLWGVVSLLSPGDPKVAALKDALDMALQDTRKPSERSLGKWLAYRVGKIVNGKRLHKGGTAQGSSCWQVKRGGEN